MGSVIVCFFIFFLKKKGKHGYFKTKNIFFQLLRAICGSFAMFFGYSALKFINLAEASTISFTKIFFVFFLASIFLKEKLTLSKILLSLLGFCGVYILSSVTMSQGNIGTLMAIFGAFFVASGIILMSYMAKDDHTLTILFYHSLFSCFLVGTFFFKNITSVSFYNIFLMLIITITALVGQYFNTESYRKNNANYIIIFSYTRILFSILFGYFFLSESLNIFQLLGLFLIVLTTMLGGRIKEI
tara:strand:+ start:1501 stop:2229 length:729 start_codon:yes stop_codon:yes gene_type:complete